jgi:Uncharacterised nucleotidyltransferase
LNLPETVRLAASGFGVDLVTAEVTAALGAAGIPCVLMKGPAIATWLYPEDGSRLYGDTDLLLPEAEWERAMGVLAGLGFEDDLGPLGHPRMESSAGYSWVRPRDGAAVDLHLTLFGLGAPPGRVWTAFAEGVVGARVGGAEVRMPGIPARLLHVALHAVQHGGEPGSKPMLDLERALARVPDPTWRQAAELAARLEGEGTFAAGLQLTAAGRELAARIGLAPPAAAAASLRVAGVPLAEGFGELAAAEGWRRKLALLASELVPSRAFMRWWTPLARRGRRGLAAAYVWRLVWLSARALPGYLAWRRAAGRPARADARPPR